MCKICRECVGHLREVFHAVIERDEGLLDLNGEMDVKILHKKIVVA